VKAEDAMPSIEEHNIATLELWLNEVHANRRVELGPELLAPSYTRHLPSGIETLTPESFTELSEAGIRSRPRFRYEWLEIVARGDRIAGVWRTEEMNDERKPRGQLGIYGFEDGKLADVWQPIMPADAGPWRTDPRPKEQWSIPTTDALSPDEQANLATVRRWADLHENRSDDLGAVTELMTDPITVHGASGTRPQRPEEVTRFLVGFRERSPGYEGSSDDLFVAGDLAARRYRYSYPEALPDRGNFQCGVILYRFEDHRITEHWSIYLPDDMDWD
jgi:predicted SnoaL-like aldol condensation-catalyzing enzyme